MEKFTFQFIAIFIFLHLTTTTQFINAQEPPPTPTPSPWPEQFHAILFLSLSNGHLQINDLWYDWPKGRNVNIIQKQLGELQYDIEWNNGTSFYYTLDPNNPTCRIVDFGVGIPRPDFLNDATYVGMAETDGFLCNVWEKVEFIRYYEDVVTKRPVRWDFIDGINQSRDQFWSRIVTEYNGSKNASLQERNRRSLQCRMTTIIKAMGKLRGCIRQIESLNRSGASEIDIYDQAKTLLYQDPEFAKGFKFDHVWEQMKNIEKFAPNHGDSSSHLNSQAPETPISSSSSGMPSFSINLSDDGSPSPTSSQRPIGIKKAKLKRKQSEDSTTQFDMLKRQNDELLEVMKHKAERDKQKAEFKQSREERKIMMIDINTISDPVARAFIESERAKIMQKRADQQNFQASNNMDGFGSLYQNIGPSGNDLSDY